MAVALLALAHCSPPAEKDATIQTGDRLDVEVFGEPELSGVFPVDSAGNLALPLLDPIQAKGMTVNALQSTLEDLLEKSTFKEVSVTVKDLGAGAAPAP